MFLLKSYVTQNGALQRHSLMWDPSVNGRLQFSHDTSVTNSVSVTLLHWLSWLRFSPESLHRLPMFHLSHHLFMRLCRYTPPPLSHMFDTPRGSTSVPDSGRTGWWDAWLCCNLVHSIDSDSWCLWHTTGCLYLGSSGRVCRSWESLPGRPDQ